MISADVRKEPGTKKWRVGDLVLDADGPKTHRFLLEIVEIRGPRAHTVYLEGSPANGITHDPGSWRPLSKLLDPASFLKTEEFLRTLHSRLR
jgi:hypothetical protein